MIRQENSFIIGVDGGSTKTIALVADTAGHILGAGRAGNCNWYTVGKEGAAAAIRQAVEAALREAKVDPEDVVFACYGITGADWPEDYPMLEELLANLHLSRQLTVKNDAYIALRAGTSQPYGVAICAGTGTNTAIVAPDGREWIYGYWADYGGAADLSRDAVRAVLRAADGRGPATALTDKVLAHLSLPTAEALLRRLVGRQISPERLRSLCPLVFDAAAEGDEVARALIVHHGHELALYATAGIRRLGMEDLEFEVVLSGSIFKGRGTLLHDTIRSDILQVAPRARVVRPRFEPAIGALLVALEAIRAPVDAHVYANLARTHPAPELFDTRGEGD
ncbi:MAG TPA: ATPase [Caldilineae bacterium]|nr:ATPase [Caldilineae bacterium]